MMKKIIVIVAFSLMLLVMVGCNSIFDPINNSQDANIVLYLADAPVNDVESVFVTIDRVEIGGDEQGWTVLNDFDADGGEKEFDLLTLRFDQALLGEAAIEPGTYEQLRLIVSALEDTSSSTETNSQGGPSNLSKSYVLYTNGETENIFIPSGTQSGLKINLNELVVEAGTVTELVLDTDVRDVLKSTGNGMNGHSKIMLRPTAIRVIEQITSGDVVGRVVDLDGEPISEYDVVIEAQNEAGEVVASTVATIEDETLEDGTVMPAGSFKLRGLAEGTYTLNVFAEDENENLMYQLPPANDPITVTVEANTVTEIETEIQIEAVIDATPTVPE